MHTSIRNLRVPDDLWNRAKIAASANDTTVSAVLVAALRTYVEQEGPSEAAVQRIIGEQQLWPDDPLDVIVRRTGGLADSPRASLH